MKPSLRELTEQALLRQLAPVGALVDSRGDIFYLYGRSGQYLELSPGEAGISNILKMAREGLRSKLTMALRTAVAAKEVVRLPGLRVKTNDGFTAVNLTVSPVATGLGTTSAAPLYLVTLEKAPPLDSDNAQPVAALHSLAGAGGPDTATDADARVAALMQELQAKEDYLQSANEELETSNDELKSSNEEMQSINEEMQSTNEELETSKEELQSVNEELAKVNAELQTKVDDLSRANNDMNNLLDGTGIATVFMDRQLRILRFTPDATRVINLILNDVGRPVGHIATKLTGYDHLSADAQSVLDSLVPKDMEVQTMEGRWFTMRIRPYRTLDNVIEGAVVTFVEITERKRAEVALQKALDDIRTLRGILPICSSCRKIRDDTGYWNQVEVFVRERTEAEFSHGICPECMKKLYPEFEQDDGSAPENKGDPQ